MKPLFLLVSLTISCQHSLWAQWQLSGLTRQNVHALLANGSVTYAGCDSGVYRSTNDGLTWERRSSGLPVSPFFSKTIAARGSLLFDGTNGAGGVYLTTNEGVTWTAANSGLTSTQVHALAFIDSVLLAGTNGNGVFRSTNNGGQWLESNAGINNFFVHSLLVTGSRVLAGTDGGVFASTDTGATWSLFPASPIDIRTLASSGSLLFAGTNTAGIFRSTDGGSTWTGMNSGLTSFFVRVVLARDGNLFAGTKGGGVHLSTNGGTSWAQINTGLDSLAILSLEASVTTLYAGADRGGVWSRPLSQVVSVNNQPASLPTERTLEQNYPNPFNPSTVIRYQIRRNAHVTVLVYDELGREVSTLVDDIQAPGEYSITWNAGRWASGTYFCRLRSGDRNEVTKMMFFK